MVLTADNLVTLLAAIGSLALIVSIITEVTKDVAIIHKIPTDIKVLVLSLTLTLVSYFAYISYSGTAIIWYYVVATIITGFIVAYVVLYGWNKLVDLYKKFRNIPPIEVTSATATSVADITTTKTSKVNISAKDHSATDIVITDTSVNDALSKPTTTDIVVTDF